MLVVFGMLLRNRPQTPILKNFLKVLSVENIGVEPMTS